MRLMLFDTETTGFPRKAGTPLVAQPEIMEFAAQVLDLTTLELDSHHAEGGIIDLRFRTQRPVPPLITGLTGICDDDLRNSPPFSAQWPRLEAFLRGVDIWCAHNLVFDVKMLGIELARLGKQNSFISPKHSFCTLNFSRAQYTRSIDKGHHKLRDLHQRLCPDSSMQQTHVAMDDVIMCLDIVRELRVQGLFPRSLAPNNNGD